MGAFLLAWLNSNGLKQIGVQIDQIFGTDIAGVLPRYNYIILGLLLVLMMLFRREGLFPESRTRALLHEPSRTEAEALGAESIEAEAETEAVEHSDAAKDARLVAAAVAMSPVLEEPEETPAGKEDKARVPFDASQMGDTPGADEDQKRAAVSVPIDSEAVQNSVLYADTSPVRWSGCRRRRLVHHPAEVGGQPDQPNGAGKTTFFNVITGLYKVTSGIVFLEGKDITNVKPHDRAAMGLARTFQNIRLFNLMTAEENVMVAMHSHLKSGVFSTIIRTPGQRREERTSRDTARELLEYVGIGKSEGELARNLSYGDQRRLRSPGPWP